MNIYEERFIHNEHEEMAVLTIIGLLYKEYISEEAKKIYDSLTDEEKKEIKKRLKHNN